MTEATTRESLEAAQRLFREGDAERASAVLEGVLGVEPENARAAHFQGVLKALAGDLPGALVHFVRALQADPRNAEILHDLGNVWYEGKNFAEARLCYRDAVALAPGKVPFLMGLARAELGLENLDEAETLVRQAVALAPGELEPVTLLAEILLVTGRNAESVPYWRQVVERNPQDETARQYLGLALQEGAGGGAEGDEGVPAEGGNGPGEGAPEPSTVFCPACGRINSAQNRKCAGCGMTLGQALPGTVATGNLLFAGDGDMELSPELAVASVEDVMRTLSSDVLAGQITAEDYLLTVDRCEEAIATLYETSMEALLRHLRVTFLERGRAAGRDAAWLATMEGQISYAHEEAFRLFTEAWAHMRQYVETVDGEDIEASVRLAREAMGWIASLDAIGSRI